MTLLTPLESPMALYISKPRWTISAEWLVVFRLATVVSRIVRSTMSSRSAFSSAVCSFTSLTAQSAGRPVAVDTSVNDQQVPVSPTANDFFIAALKLPLKCDCQVPARSKPLSALISWRTSSPVSRHNVCSVITVHHLTPVKRDDWNLLRVRLSYDVRRRTHRKTQ